MQQAKPTATTPSTSASKTPSNPRPLLPLPPLAAAVVAAPLPVVTVGAGVAAEGQRCPVRLATINLALEERSASARATRGRAPRLGMASTRVLEGEEVEVGEVGGAERAAGGVEEVVGEVGRVGWARARGSKLDWTFSHMAAAPDRSAALECFIYIHQRCTVILTRLLYWAGHTVAHIPITTSKNSVNATQRYPSEQRDAALPSARPLV